MQIGEWLGFVIDSISLSFRIPEKKVSKLKGLLDSAIQAGYSSFRELARIAGTIISVALAVGPISRLLTRQMYFAIETRSAWDNTIHFSPSLLRTRAQILVLQHRLLQRLFYKATISDPYRCVFRCK